MIKQGIGHPSNNQSKSKLISQKNDSQLPPQTQYCEFDHPYLIVKYKNINDIKISEQICGLANQQRGYILLCEQHQNQIIKRGYTNFDHQAFLKNVKASQQMITDHENIQLKVTILPIYQFVNGEWDKQSSQFVIQILVNTKPPRKLYFVNNLSTDNLEEKFLYRLTENKQPSLTKFSLQKIMPEEIYTFIQNNAIEMLKSSTKPKQGKKLTKYKIQFAPQRFMIESNLASQQISPIKLIPSFLQIFKNFGNESLKNNFPKIQENQKVAILLLNQKIELNNSINLIKQFLMDEMNYWGIMPFPQFQKKLLKNQKFKMAFKQMPIFYYFAFEGQFTKFAQKIRGIFGREQKYRIVDIQELTLTKVQSVQLNQQNYFACQNFLWQFFECIPILKRDKTLPRLDTSEKSKKSSYLFKVEFSYEKKDRNAAVFMHFLFRLAKKIGAKKNIPN